MNKEEQHFIEGIHENEVYRDQGGSSIAIYDRRITSFYTAHGINCIESNYAAMIQNIGNKVKATYKYSREPEIKIDKNGKEYEGLRHIDTFVKCGIIERGWLGKKVIWDNGQGGENVRLFTQGDNWIEFDEQTNMVCPIKLKKSIEENPHLHQVIKNNLLLNLDSYLKKGC